MHLLPAKPIIRWVFGVGYILLFLALFAGLYFEQNLGLPFAKILTFTTYTFLLAVIYMALSFLVIDLVGLINRFIHFAPAGMYDVRQWTAVISLVVIAIVLIIGNYRFNHPALVQLDLTVENPIQHKEIKIVAASDIHLGTSIDKKMLHRYVQMINARKPDIIMLVGDITDRSFGPVMEQKMEQELSQLHAPLGVFAISGNHEYYSGVPEEINEYLRAAGIRMLHDSVALVDHSFYLIGRDDRTNPNRQPLEALIKGLKPELPKILLDHQPYALEQACNNGIDLQISGHTHNGQFFPGNLFVAKIFELGHGYLKKGKTHFYVSSGLGIWGPLYRIGTQSELVEIQLKY
ncbi:MAG TPA: metallophosphoesterase [Bacteroidales bacterium]|nr:metallophosphoesterase [Bacteroidales bacterium]